MAQSTAPAGVYRPLGDMEYLYWMMGLASRVNFIVVCSVTGEVSAAALTRALKRVQATQPLLNVCIVPHPKLGAVFTFLDRAPIPLEIESVPVAPGGDFEFDTAITARIEAEQRFDFGGSTMPLMRCRLLRHGDRQATLLLNFHHAIGDARSGVRLAATLVEALDDVPSATVEDGSCTADWGPVEQRIPSRFKGASADLKLLGYTLGQRLRRAFHRPVHLPVDQRAWADERRERFILTRLDREETRRVIQAARSHGCTVHGLLLAATLHGLLEAYPERRGIRTYLVTLADLRKRLGLDPGAACLKVGFSMVETYHHILRGASLVDTAQGATDAVDRMIQKGFHLYYFPRMARAVRRVRRFEGNEAGSRRMLRVGERSLPPVISVSNIGRVDRNGTSPTHRIDALHFVLPLSSSGCFGSAVTTFDGRLHWNFSYADPAVTEAQAVQMARACIARLTGVG